jgi:predicted TPR repeat methyltransferase
MEANSSDFKAADAFAAHYDETAEKYGWYAPEVLFALVFCRLESGQSLLDLGIGTGLSAAPFKKAGLQVHGVDGSKAMLRHCESRGVAIDLKQHDIRTAHLDDIFAEAARVIREAGTFVFTT